VATAAAILVFNMYIFTIDRHGEETSLDLVKDFTALVLIINLDNFLRTAVDVEVQELTQVYNLPFVPLSEKYDRYVDF